MAASQPWNALPVDLAEKQSDGRPPHDNMLIQCPRSSAPGYAMHALESAMVRNLDPLTT